MSSELKRLIAEINQFREERDWKKFHNEKDLAVSIVLESAELLELFQWKSSEETTEQKIGALSEELADILIYCLMMTDNLGLDPESIIQAKLESNREKYPVAKAFGRSTKYNEFEAEDR